MVNDLQDYFLFVAVIKHLSLNPDLIKLLAVAKFKFLELGLEYHFFDVFNVR